MEEVAKVTTEPISLSVEAIESLKRIKETNELEQQKIKRNQEPLKLRREQELEKEKELKVMWPKAEKKDIKTMGIV